VWPPGEERLRYGRRSAGKTKLEALREAQLELLRGTAESLQRTEPARSLVQGQGGGKPWDKPVVKAPPFPVDPHAPYAHPYCWAPFFLMGNWI
jgi:CHAT domain-containing protein